MDYQHIITIEPGKRSGKPCIRGMRITVYDILEYLAGGMTEAEILEDFSELTSEDIKACLAFAADRVSRADQIESDPVLGMFLNFLTRDIEKNPQHLKAISSDLVSRVQSLVCEVDLDLDAPLSDEDE